MKSRLLMLIFLMTGFFATSLYAGKKQVCLQLVETSDIHGCFFPFDYITNQPMKGSMARVSTYLKTLRKNNDNVVLLDCGDILQGQPVSYFSNYIDTLNSNIAAEVCNYLNYDAQTIGNHDIEPGHQVYDAWHKATHCPQLGANIIDTKTGKPYFRPYTIISRQGVRIAILGLLTPAIPNWLPETLWSGLRFDDMVTTARQWMDYIRKNEHPDLVVGLFHSGQEGGIVSNGSYEDASLTVAREVPGFDIVFYGHDHTKYCGTVVNKEGKTVWLLDPANKAMRVTQATVNLHKDKGKWTIESINGQLVDVTDMAVDEEFCNHFKSFTDKVKAFANEQIGTLQKDIFSRDGFFGNSAFNDLIQQLQLDITHADISLSAPLQFNAVLKKGPIRIGDMFNLYKFENQLYVMRLTGREIRNHLEMSYDQWVNTMKSPDDHLLLLNDATKGDQQRLGFKNFTFNFDSASGIDYVVDVTKPDGQKVTILRMSDGRPFDENKFYKVALNSYRANGGGELLTKGAGIPKDSLEGRTIWKSKRDLRHYLIEEIRRRGTLDPQAAHNWKFIPEDWTKEAAKRDYELLFGKK